MADPNPTLTSPPIYALSNMKLIYRKPTKAAKLADLRRIMSVSQVLNQSPDGKLVASANYYSNKPSNDTIAK